MNIRNIVLFIVIPLCAVVISSVYFSYNELMPLSPQSEHMLDRSVSFNRAIERGGLGFFPPGYAVFLYIIKSINVSPRWANLSLLFFTLFLLYIYSKKYIQNIDPIWIVLFYSMCAFNYWNLSQFTSEAMVIPLSILVYLTLLVYIKKQDYFTLVVLSILCSMIFISRYHAMLWLLPIMILNIIIVSKRTKWWKDYQFIIFNIISLGPVGLFLLRNYKNSGYLTGMPRIGYESRNIDPSMVIINATSFNDNIRLTLKTFFLDFMSPFKYPDHEVNYIPYNFSIIEIGLILLFVLTLSIVFSILYKNQNNIHTCSFLQTFKTDCQYLSSYFILAEFFFGYILITIIAWTFTNNDALYSRFLYPSYIYFILLMFIGFSFVKRNTSSAAFRLPFIMLYFSLLLINLYKIAITTHLIK